MMSSVNKAYKIDWAFLLFITGSMYVKLYVKIAAIAFYALYVLYRKYKFPKPNRINLFYFLILMVGTASALLNSSFGAQNYRFGFLLGALQWILAGAVSYLTYVFVTNKSQRQVQTVIKYFFGLNLAVSIIHLGVVAMKSGSLFPYWLVGTEEYGASTGDYIQGVLGSSSVVNAVVSSLASIYFLFQKELKWALLCLLCMLLCTSNVTLVFYVVVLMAVLVAVSDNEIRKNVLLILLVTALSYPIMSPQNIQYAEVIYSRSSQGDNKIGKQEAVVYDRPKVVTEAMNVDEIVIAGNTDEYKITDLGDVVHAKQVMQYKDNVDHPFLMKSEFRKSISNYRVALNKNNVVNIAEETKALLRLSEKNTKEHKTSILDPMLVKQSADRWYQIPMDKSYLSTYYKPVKLYSLQQTGYYLLSTPQAFLLGAGIGNFSSKLAIKTSGIGIQGAYPEKYNYISQLFAQYHFYTMVYVLGLHPSEHSIINMPYSGLNNLAGEYGVIGMVVFAFFYVLAIWKHRRNAKVLPFILLLFLMFWGVEYWFELLSLTVIFELIVFEKLYSKQYE